MLLFIDLWDDDEIVNAAVVVSAVDRINIDFMMSNLKFEFLGVADVL